MDFGHMYEQFYGKVKPALESKLEEFSMLGYGTVTEKELWDYLTKKKWKKPKEDVHVYEIVADILSVQPGQFMNYATVEAFKFSGFSFEDDQERLELLK
ncbi:post-transcriptional regulator [Bacillus sp. T33-2]|uniref:post-transcriptional regulator n=1 Tax=Bacillus sp. T33-2 TaxID=2054168 RepID=UPI000C75DD69|nr:post-transcriptional regulator [Bacillus sp. T33-2]PLR93746.1 post-transcriptional regulator [Bacillus sp. T33-2]